MEVKIKPYYTIYDSIFLMVETVIAFILLFIPLILYLVNDRVLLPSISAYVDINNSHIFGLLLVIASMLFIFNGALYFRIDDDIKNNNLKTKCGHNKPKVGKWYNIILGIALLGVAIFHFEKQETLHIVFAVLFFVGSAVVMFFIHDPNDRWKSRFLAIGILVGLSISIYDATILSLFWSETIALIIIGIYYILESRRIWIRF